jgi:hypothetical protein
MGGPDRPEKRLQHRIHGPTPKPSTTHRWNAGTPIGISGFGYVGHDHFTGHTDSSRPSPDPLSVSRWKTRASAGAPITRSRASGDRLP